MCQCSYLVPTTLIQTLTPKHIHTHTLTHMHTHTLTHMHTPSHTCTHTHTPSHTHTHTHLTHAHTPHTQVLSEMRTKRVFAPITLQVKIMDTLSLFNHGKHVLKVCTYVCISGFLQVLESWDFIILIRGPGNVLEFRI